MSPKKKSTRDCFLTVLHAGLKKDRPAADSIRCSFLRLDGMVMLTISRKIRAVWQPVTTIRFREAGPIEMQCDYNGQRSNFTAPGRSAYPANAR